MSLAALAIGRRRDVPAAVAALHGDANASGDREGVRSSPLGARRRQLADRHQPRDLGDDAVGQGARRGRALTSWLDDAERATLLDWLLGQQYRVEHPYTHAAPGGWAWTDLAGGVPDADDTAGALLALAHLLGPAGSPSDARVRDAAEAGVRWLLDLQNRDGGMPTFCRGWTGLPFDRSGPDLTAHAVRAWWRGGRTWRARWGRASDARSTGPAATCARPARRRRLRAAVVRQRAAPGEVNPTYGTAKVLPALDALADAGIDGAAGMADRAARWLAAAQRPDGGWGGASGRRRRRGAPLPSIEETALAVAALAAHAGRTRRGSGARRSRPRLAADATDDGRPSRPRRSASTSRASGTARRSTR